jgi:uncharacterized protein YbjT (DUF2867 family)
MAPAVRHIAFQDAKMMDAKRILVFGATGRQGGAVAQVLHHAGFQVVGATRRPSSPRAMDLVKQGMQVVAADLDDAASYRTALEACDGVFSVQNFWEKGVGATGEIRQAEQLIQAAERAEVGHFVQSVMASAKSFDGIEHFETKHRVAERLRQSSLSHSTLGTVWFMDNMLDPKMGGSLTMAILAGSLKPETRFPMLAVEDIGNACSKIFRSPEEHAGRHFDLIGDWRTVTEMKSIYRGIRGRSTKWYRIPNWMMQWLNREFAAQLRWHNAVNFLDDPSSRPTWPDKLTDFATFLEANPSVKL